MMRMSPRKRLGFLAWLGFAVVLLTACGTTGSGDGADVVRVRLDWLVEGSNSGFIMADQLGYYRDANIEVTIGAGKGSGNTVQAIAAGDDDFGYADGYALAQGRAQGMPLIMVASIYRSNPAAVITLKESGLQSIEELHGKRLGIPPGSAQAQQWPAVVEGCGLDPDQIEIVSVEPAATAPAILEGDVDAVAGFAGSHVPGIEITGGKETTLFWYRDCGVKTISNGIIVREELVREHPDLVRRFVEATIRGFLYARTHPEETVAALHSYSDTIVDELEFRNMEIYWEVWESDASRGHPLGYMPPEQWEATVDILKNFGGVDAPLDPEELYTNEFVPSGDAYRIPES